MTVEILGGLPALAVVVAPEQQRRLAHTAWGSHTLREVCADYARCVRTGPRRAAMLAGAGGAPHATSVGEAA
jgi:hypothetical protein